MDDLQRTLIWVVGGLLTLVTTIGSWFFQNINKRVSYLEERQAKLETRLEMKVLSLESKIEINSERDKAFQDKVMTALESIAKWQEEFKKEIKELYQNKNDNV